MWIKACEQLREPLRNVNFDQLIAQKNCLKDVAAVDDIHAKPLDEILPAAQEKIQ